MSSIIGIDPGINGALAILDPENAVMRIIDMPIFVFETTRTKKLVDPYAVAEFCAEQPLASGVIEEVNSSSQMGVTSAFTFGEGKGILLGVLAALNVPLSQVKPTQWKKAMRVPADKRAAVMRASQLLPKLAPLFKGPRGGVIDGRAEAAILALYHAMELGRSPRKAVTIWQ